MADTELEFQERLRLRIERMIAQVMRADETTIVEVVQHARDDGLVDEHTAGFLLVSRRLLLATTVSLSAGLDLHRLRQPAHGTTATCPACGTEGRCRTVRRIADTLALYSPGPVTVSRAEAWRRADGHFNPSGASDQFIGIHETADAYITWAIPGHYVGDEQPATHATVLIVDKSTGLLFKWPALPLPVLTEQYHRHVLGISPRPRDHRGS